jgi:pimeloyl-ACP methyl ester carboxylesterase
MDDWDPAFVDAVAASHRVILFDNAGVSSSSGEVPLTLGAAADDAVAFAKSLGIDKACVLGWSMGGLIAQEIVIRHSDFARQAIVIGAVPPGPTSVPTQPLFSTTARKPAYEFEDQVTLFFTQSEASRQAARRSLDRMAARTIDREPPVSVAAYTNQTAAIRSFHEDLDALAKIEATDVPILVLNGNQDIANPVENWYALGAKARSAEIHVFADAAHGSHHQFPERAAEEINSFIRAHQGRTSDAVGKGDAPERQPFDIAWRTIDGLKIRYASSGTGGEKVVLFSPWPESIFAFAPVWRGLTNHFEVLAVDLPGFGGSEARDDLYAPQKMGEFIVKVIEAFGLTSVHAVGLDVGSPSLLFATSAKPELFRSLIVGAGASTYPLVVEGNLKSLIEAEKPPSLNAVEFVGRFLGAIHGYAVPGFVRDDYIASYEGDRMTRSAALVRAYPKDLAALTPRLASIEVPVAIVVGRNDPYGLARDAALLRDRLPHARLDVLEANHCFWEERSPEFEAIVTQWVSGGFRR